MFQEGGRMDFLRLSVRSPVSLAILNPPTGQVCILEEHP